MIEKVIKHKKVKKVFLIILVLVLLLSLLGLSLFFGYRHFIEYRNVFDQMFHSRFDYGDSRDRFRPRNTFLYEQLNERERQRAAWGRRPGALEEVGWDWSRRWSSYRHYLLEDGQGIFFRFTEEPLRGRRRGIEFVFWWMCPDREVTLYLEYQYHIETRELIKVPPRFSDRHLGIRVHIYDEDYEDYIDDYLSRIGLTREEIDELHYSFFFERVLGDWFEANRWHTRFSPNNLGQFTFVDKTE